MPYGDIRADRIITSTQTISFDELAITRDAYKIAVDNGFVGTEAQWLATLVGPEGPPGEASNSLSELADVDISDKAANSVLYFNESSAKFTADDINTLITLSDGGNF